MGQDGWIRSAFARAGEPYPAAREGCSVIESLGMYLPPRAVSTSEVLAGCKARINYDLEALTGIRHRRIGGDGEYCLEYAEKAARDCLSRSRFDASAIGLLICCNISRYEGPGRFVIEPAMALKLARRLGLMHALTLDVCNACAGTFTAIEVADAMLAAGTIESALIVSGEHISAVAKTAQIEIEGDADPQLASLTLGDSGLALTLARAANGSGFEHIDLYTLGRYASYCVGQVSPRPGSEFAMKTDSVRLARSTVRELAGFIKATLERCGWSASEVTHWIGHQTSRASMVGSMRAMNHVFGEGLFHSGNVVDNLAERGNTATTTHFVAAMDLIRDGRIEDGDSVVFIVLASGVVVGAALYRFDDLPSRLRKGGKSQVITQPAPYPARSPARLRVESVCVSDAPADGSLAMARRAAEQVLKRSRYARTEIDQIIFAGNYRSDFLFEPAMASLLAGELRMNDAKGRKRGSTAGFDLRGGGTGVLASLYLAQQLISAGRRRCAMVLTSEVQHPCTDGEALRVAETAAACVVDAGDPEGPGFECFHFATFPRFIDDFETATRFEIDRVLLDVRRSPGQQQQLLNCCVETVSAFLTRQGLSLEDIAWVVPPPLSRAFVADFAARLGVRPARLVDVSGERDAISSGVLAGLAQIEARDAARSGERVLLVSVAPGVQVGCALYRV